MSCRSFSTVLKEEYRQIFNRRVLQRAEALAAAMPKKSADSDAEALAEAKKQMGQMPPCFSEPDKEHDGSQKAEDDALKNLDQAMQQLKEADGKAPTHKLAALCFSGGGIRSATFNLGVLQKLACHGLLDQFDYLSTVSGGGFIGSWLMAWAQRGGGLGKVAKLLNADSSKPVKHEPHEIKHLRDFSRYMSPRTSLLSADTWALAAIYIRNLLLNWTVLVPLLLAALMLPRLSAAVIDLFPILEQKTCAVAGPAAPITVKLQVTTPATDLSMAMTHTPGRGDPAPAASDDDPPRVGTAPWYSIYILYGLGILFIGGAYWFALRSEPVAFRSAPPSSRRKPKDDTGVIPSAKKRTPPFQPSFIWLCLFPLVVGACLLSTGWAWDKSSPTGRFHVFILLFGISMPLIAAVALLASKKWHGILWQMGATVGGGLVAGALLWLSASLLEMVHKSAAHVFHNSSSATADGWETAIYACLAVPLVVGSLGAGAMLRIGLLSRLSDSTDEFREWWARFGAWAMIVVAAWLVIWVLVLLAPGLLLYTESVWARTGWAALGGASGLFTILMGKSSKTPATDDAARSAGPSGRAMQILLAIAAPVFICLIIASLSLATDGLLACRFGFTFDDDDFIRPAPKASGVEWHFAMVEVFDDDTEIDPDVQKYIGNESNREKTSPNHLRPWNSGYAWPSLKELQFPWDVPPPGPDCYARARIRHQFMGEVGSSTWLLIWFFGLLGVGGGMSLLINLNRFSLHEVYRDRLIRAYLGASHQPRAADPFTGFDERDNLRMHELRAPDQDPKNPHRGPHGSLPIHLINMTLNIDSESTELSWQDRMAVSFTVSPYSSGSNELGYRDTEKYGSPDHGISVGTAVAISGAAVSPNMGSHSSTFLAFLLAFFNVRVGAWLGNPGTVGDDTYRRGAPKSGALHIVAEAFGLASATHKYVYLSDGGHFENLALYEMVRRRCRYIVVCDAGADPDYGFEDLANAVRKVRIDFGISITFDPSVSIVGMKDLDVAKGKYCAIGRIQYDSIKKNDGFLLYIKPAFYKRNEPIDVRAYAGMSKPFPQEPTSDQFFTESQFESYRALGEHIVDEIQGRGKDDDSIEPAGTLDEFQKRVKANLAVETTKTRPRRQGFVASGGRTI